MDFFAAQDRAKTRTRVLVVYFILGVLGLVISLNVLAMVAEGIAKSSNGGRVGRLYSAYNNYGDSAQPASFAWDPALSVLVTLVTLAVVGGACAYKISELHSGGGAVALSVGATPLSPHPSGLAEKQLRNVVEEMSLASGVPVPAIYIMEDEEGINAFAAGLRPEDAAIVVTRGALKYLNREELEGVIGHEFSHILNGDMRINMQLIGAVFGLLVLAIIGRVVMQSIGRGNFRGRNSGGGAVLAILALGFALFVLGSLGVLFGRLIQSAVSRQREGLADASSVQFTRNPAGLAGALKKIGGLAAGSYINHAHVQETAHMYIAPALNTIFATHPPLEERIRELEPNWDGKFINPREGMFNDGLASCAGDTPPESSPASSLATAQGFLAPAAMVAALSVAKVRDWRANLPGSIAAALASTKGCRALVVALALDHDSAHCAEQIARLREEQDPSALTALDLTADVAAVEEGRRLPLLELALAGLANLTPPEKTFLLARLRDLTGFDSGNQNMYQFALWRVAQCRLDPKPPTLGPPEIEYYRKDISVLLSALAHLSTPDDQAALPVYQQGLTAIPHLAGLELTPRAHATLSDVEGACARLDGIPFALKKQVLEAGALIVQADGVIEPAEAELLRAIAATLGCPVPLN